MTTLALASLLLPPGPVSLAWFLGAVAVTALTVVAGVGGLWQRLPLGMYMGQLVAVAAVTVLNFAAGQSSGLVTLLLVPVVYTALYGRRRDLLLVIPAVIAALLILGLDARLTPVVMVRRVFVYGGLAALIGLSAHMLRARLETAVASATEQARQAGVLADAARALSASLEPALVIDTATHLTALLTALPGAGPRRGQYFTVDGNVVTIAADSDDTGASVVGETFPLSSHPWLPEVVAGDKAMTCRLDADRCGPGLREIVTVLGITHAAWVPVRCDGQLHGIVCASTRGVEITDQLLDRLRALGALTELALSNAVAHTRAREQATIDPLTELTNRRGFELALDSVSQRSKFVIVAIDVDGLKAVNDRFGHAAGDRMIAGVGAALRSVVRRGDTLARIGGDEFAVIMSDAGDAAVDRLSQRMHAAMRLVSTANGEARISIGAAHGAAGDDPHAVAHLADQALYESKRKGGGVTSVRRDVPTEALA